VCPTIKLSLAMPLLFVYDKNTLGTKCDRELKKVMLKKVKSKWTAKAIALLLMEIKFNNYN